MKSYIAALTSVTLLLLSCIKAECQASPAKPLQETIRASTMISVCRLTKFIANPVKDVDVPTKPAGTTPNGTPYYIGGPLMFNAIDSVKPPGTYEFDVNENSPQQAAVYLKEGGAVHCA